MPSSTGTLVFNDQKIQAPDIYATESLGVGVSDPTSNLEVVGNAYVSSNLEVGTANLFVDTTTGRVGVGTGSPQEKLDVNGIGRISSDYPRLDLFTTTSRSTNDWGNSTGAAGDYRIYSNGDASDGTKRSLNFDYGQNSVHTTRMCINALGNVGIGTTNPGAKLDVNGHILNNNPAFWAYDSGSTTATATGAWTYFGDTTLNIGSHYDTTNKRFYAPIAGTYSFQGSALYRYRSALGRCELTFYKNGTNVNTRGLSYSLLNLSSGHAQATISYIINLNAGDYMQIGAHAIDSGVDFYVGQGLGYFSGYLIG